jgi:hypothetical protein
MLWPSNIRVSAKTSGWGAIGILGLLFVGAIQFVGADSQSRYQAIADGAFDARATAKSLLIRALQLRHHKRDYAMQGGVEDRDE